MSNARVLQDVTALNTGSPARKKNLVDMPSGRSRSRVFRRGGSTKVSFMSTTSQASVKTLNGAETDFLHAAEFGDIPGIRRLISENPDINVDCIDILGRTGLKLAVKNEHLEIVELLLDKSSINHIYEAALQAISAGHVPIAECILKHKRYLDLTRDRRKFGATDSFFTTLDLDESQFSPDLTPLILASQKNQYEIVQLLLLRGETIPRPHRFNCHCKECSNKTEFDQLRLAISRLNAYRGLASEAYVSLSSKDPILTAFELASELRHLTHIEKYFKTEYYQLANNLSDYVVKLLDRVRTHDELEMVLNKTGKGGVESFSKLARFKLALRYDEKKFVAHPACQQRLVNIWYAGMRKLERSSWPQRFVLMTGFVILYPFLVLLYSVAPSCKAAAVLKYPCVKFLIHAVSFITFLILIITSTAETSFGTDEDITLAKLYPDVHAQYMQFQNESGRKFFDPNFTIRPFMPTVFQILLMLWVAGFLCQECSQLYTDGLSAYHKSLYNMLDYVVICTYTASFTLFGLSMIKVHLCISHIRQHPLTTIEDQYYYTYWLNADRYYWDSFDPINLAEALFAMGNIISFSRISYLLPANEALGPMQISLGRMIKDILKFLCVMILVMVAFLVGLHNLFWYYSARSKIETVDRHITTRAEQNFGNVLDTFRTIFWSIFGRGEPSVVKLDEYENDVTENIGYIIYGAYNVASVTVLLNMLIAMMTRSFENIAEDADVEWKFGRSQLYMDYISRHSVLPVPLNLLAVPKSIFQVIMEVCGCCTCCGCCDDEETASPKGRRNAYSSNGRDNSAYDETSVTEHAVFDPKKMSKFHDISRKSNAKDELTYEKVMQRVIKRYIFELEREAEVTEDDFEEIKQDISSFRYEILNLLKVREDSMPETSNFTKVAHMVQCLREDVFSVVKNQRLLGREAFTNYGVNTASTASPSLAKRIFKETQSVALGESANASFDRDSDPKDDRLEERLNSM